MVWRQPNLMRGERAIARLVEQHDDESQGEAQPNSSRAQLRRIRQRREARKQKRKHVSKGHQGTQKQKGAGQSAQSRGSKRKQTQDPVATATQDDSTTDTTQQSKKRRKKSKKKKGDVSEHANDANRDDHIDQKLEAAAETQRPAARLDKATPGSQNSNFMKLLREQNLIADDGSDVDAEEDEDDRVIREMEKKLGLNKPWKGKKKGMTGDPSLDYLLGYDIDGVESGDEQGTLSLLDNGDALEQHDGRRKEDRFEDIADSDASGDDDNDLSDDDDDLGADMEEKLSDSDSDAKQLAHSGDDVDSDSAASDDDDDKLEEALGSDDDAETADADGREANAFIGRSGVYGDNVVAADGRIASASGIEGASSAVPAGDSDDEAHRSDDDDEADVSLVTSRYVPPALRRKLDQEGTVYSAKTRAVRGLLNRLNESNLAVIVKELDQHFATSSRNLMCQIISTFVIEACINHDRTLGHLLRIYSACVAALHSVVGAEVSAHFLQTLVRRLDKLYTQSNARLLQQDKRVDETEDPVDKRCLNMASVLAYLYFFRAAHSKLICDLLNKWTTHLTALDVELILAVLQIAGLKLRKDDPDDLHSVLTAVEDRSAQQTDNSRVRFMVDSIADLKANKKKLIRDQATVLDPLSKVIRSCVKTATSGKSTAPPLRVSLTDLLDAKKRGRWWLVGAAWSGRNAESSEQAGSSVDALAVAAEDDDTVQRKVESTKLLELAKKQHMNTESRKRIFVALMGSEDYVDAVDRVLRLKLKGKQEREIVRVVLECCLQERVYNPFYAHVLAKLCELSTNHKVTLQYALWDRFKLLESMDVSQLAHLMRLVAHVVSNQAVSLAVLKTIDFAALSSAGVFAFQLLMAHLLTDYPQETVEATFGRLADNTALYALRDGLMVFLQTYCRQLKVALGTGGGQLPNTSSIKERRSLLLSRIRLVKRVFARANAMLE